ncbi:MAG: ZIP family metal transporter [Methylotenera sp.]|jgi:zinc transporter, ZIP family
MTEQSFPPAWHAFLKEHLVLHPFAAIALAISASAVIFLLTQSALNIVEADVQSFKWALMAGVAGFLATAIGALPALLLRELPQKFEDSMLGFAAGMMLAASTFSLIIPGIDAGKEIFNSQFISVMVVVAGLAFGVMLMLGLDQFTPHEHEKTGPCGPGYEICERVWLFVFAIALHNLPEGMAMGVGFSNGDVSVGLPLATAIAIQDMPEGLAVALSLRAAGAKAGSAVLIAAASGLLEPLGAIIGVTLTGGSIWSYPLGLGLAGGAMIFVVSHEVIPETHRNGHQTLATIGLMIGFALMMVLDTTLG